MKRRIILAGGSGFLGNALAQKIAASGDEVVVLTRSPRKIRADVEHVFWDGKRTGDWVRYLEGARAVINLTGKNINCPHTPENLHEIVSSRVDSVNVLAAAFGQVKFPPAVWIQAGAVGFYGDTEDRICDETAPAGGGILAGICRDWEKAFDKTNLPDTRKITLRIGVVLGRDGGALPVLSRLTKFFLGGAAGGGRQFVSWIHLADLVQMFMAAIENENFSGVFNAVAPKSVSNAELMRDLRQVLHRPWSPPAPEFAVKIGARFMGGEPSLALISQRCIPARFEAAGFQFQFPELRGALQNLNP